MRGGIEECGSKACYFEDLLDCSRLDPPHVRGRVGSESRGSVFRRGVREGIHDVLRVSGFGLRGRESPRC